MPPFELPHAARLTSSPGRSGVFAEVLLAGARVTSRTQLSITPGGPGAGPVRPDLPEYFPVAPRRARPVRSRPPLTRPAPAPGSLAMEARALRGAQDPVARRDADPLARRAWIGTLADRPLDGSALRRLGCYPFVPADTSFCGTLRRRPDTVLMDRLLGRLLQPVNRATRVRPRAGAMALPAKGGRA